MVAELDDKTRCRDSQVCEIEGECVLNGWMDVCVTCDASHYVSHPLIISINSALSCDASSGVRVGKRVERMVEKACSALTRIWALPARRPEESSVLGRSCRLKFPSLIFF